MKTMSDFIMEQEVSTGADGDLDVIKNYMEMTAIAAVAECYCEHAAIAGFCAESGFSVFSESDDNIFKKAWAATKQFFENIWNWIKALVQAVLGIFKSSSIDKCIMELDKAINSGAVDKDDKCEISAVLIDAEAVLSLIEDFKDDVTVAADASEDKKSVSVKQMENFIEKADKWKQGFKDHKKKDDWGTAGWGKPDDKGMMTMKRNGKGGDFTFEDLRNALDRMKRANIPSRGSKLLKQIDFDKKKIQSSNKKDTDKAVITAIKKAANALAKVYDKYQSETIKMARKILKKEISEHNLENLQNTGDEYKRLDNMTKNGDGKRKSFVGSKSEPEPEPESTTESYADDTSGSYFFL